MLKSLVFDPVHCGQCSNTSGGLDETYVTCLVLCVYGREKAKLVVDKLMFTAYTIGNILSLSR